eukprot:GILK01001766.1.p1 GENE.GILK01001766.1~~GILK01001766.1.p1  ORF type:complete len:498 (+),score=73.31 GILK01001766.1:52-1494(+)
MALLLWSLVVFSLCIFFVNGREDIFSPTSMPSLQEASFQKGLAGLLNDISRKNPNPDEIGSGYDVPVIRNGKPLPCKEYDLVDDSYPEGCDFATGVNAKCNELFVCNWETRAVEREVISSYVWNSMRFLYRTRIGRLANTRWLNQQLTDIQSSWAKKACTADDMKTFKLTQVIDVLYEDGYDCKDISPCFSVLVTTCKPILEFILSLRINAHRVFSEIEGVTSTVSKMQDGTELKHYDLSDVYKCKNDFFIRKLKGPVGSVDYPRKIAGRDDAGTIVSAADSRTLVFENLDAAHTFWVKGENNTLFNMLSPFANELSIDVKDYAGGRMVIHRLAPQDYHRFHFPVDGKISGISTVKGQQLYSVNPIAITSPLDVFGTNKRMVVAIDTLHFGKVLFVPVGATVVASIVITAALGESHLKGDELGYFQFGGSTVLVLFPRNVPMAFDSELTSFSSGAEGHRFPLEASMRMGQFVGSAQKLNQ